MHLFTKDKAFYRQFFSLLLFIALQNLVSYSVSLADSIMLSNYSQNALSGVTQANQVQFLLQMIVTSAGEGVVVLASQYWGKGEKKPIIPITSIGLAVAAVIGVVFTVAVSLAPRPIMCLLSNEEAIIQEGVDYLRVIRYTYLFYCLSTVILASLRSVESVRVGLVIMFMSLFVNLGLNYCLIFGKLGCREMGTTGAALATLAARAFEFVAACVYLFLMDKKLRVRPKQLFHFDRALNHDYAKYATPVMLAGASWGVAMFVQTAIIGRMGTDAIAANATVVSLFGMISVFAYGAGNAAGVITGKLVGEGDDRRLREYVRTMQGLFLLIGLVTGAALYLLRYPILEFYHLETKGAHDIALQFTTVLAITVVGTAYQAPCLGGIVRGGGHTKFVFYNDLIFQWGVVLVLSALAQFVWKLDPVWVFLCLKSDQILKCAVAVYEVNSYHWIRHLTRDTAAE